VFDAIRARDPLFFLVTGDFFYGNIDTDSARRFREAYGASLTAPAQAALYRSAPVAYVWDDHDYGPNDGDRTSQSRSTAQRVYRQLVPHYLVPAGRIGPIYQAFTVGRVRFILTDLRSERSPSGVPDGPGKTMLGAVQKAWFKRQLVGARENGQLVAWVSTVPWIGAPSAGSDTWAGYATERRELADFIASQGPLVMLAGDAHMVAIDDGSHSGYSGSGAPGFPVMHAAPLDRPGGTKGGSFSEGTYPGSGQFGTLTVRDRGARLEVELAGWRYTGRRIVSYTFEVAASGR
jgi:phosphodiesterase/alkaline phosphatase D-like protein